MVSVTLSESTTGSFRLIPRREEGRPAMPGPRDLVPPGWPSEVLPPQMAEWERRAVEGTRPQRGGEGGDGKQLRRNRLCGRHRQFVARSQADHELGGPRKPAVVMVDDRNRARTRVLEPPRDGLDLRGGTRLAQ